MIQHDYGSYLNVLAISPSWTSSNKREHHSESAFAPSPTYVLCCDWHKYQYSARLSTARLTSGHYARRTLYVPYFSPNVPDVNKSMRTRRRRQRR